ncbi:MAG: putative DNA-binding domain-containing protein [Ketobacteraceae bacterium]|nr:putative DNA-binding domain-containing protein [Ketobacteraceae bacterium]
MKFQESQYRFAAHIRHPELNQAPEDIEDRRMGIYRDLFYKNIEGFLTNGFPVLRQITSDDHWHSMVRDFMNRHQCRSPYFARIAREFLEYLDGERTPHEADFPFLLELAHYEWVELALDISEQEIPATGYNPAGDLLSGHPVVSPLAWVLQYQYPVHQIGPGFIPTEPAEIPVFLLVYRNRDDQVRFMEINAVTARLLSIFQERELCRGEDAVAQLIDELQHPNPDVVYQGARQALAHLLEKEIILGTALKPIK